MKNKIEDLRNHLFATLEALQDKENPMDLERAKTIAGVADVLVRTAKVEVDMINATGGQASPFFPEAPAPTNLPPPAVPRLVKTG